MEKVLTLSALPTAAGGWQWLLPLMAGILVAAFVLLQADACDNQPPKIPAHSDQPMKD